MMREFVFKENSWQQYENIIVKKLKINGYHFIDKYIKLMQLPYC